MEFYLDEENFKIPLQKAIADVTEELVDSGRTVRGASQRGEAAYRELNDLKAFSRRITGLIERRGFSGLPAIRGTTGNLPYYKHLSIGRWRGVFLVAPDDSVVVGIDFSRAPHDHVGDIAPKAAPHASKFP